MTDDEPIYPKDWRKMSQFDRLSELAKGHRPPSSRRSSRSSKHEVIELLALVMQGNKKAIDKMLNEWERNIYAIRRLTIAMVYEKEQKPPVTPLSLHKGLLSKEGQKFLPNKSKKPNQKWIKAFIKMLNENTNLDDIDTWITQILTLKPPRVVRKKSEPGELLIKVPKLRQPTLQTGIEDDRERVFAFITDVRFSRELPEKVASVTYVNSLFGTNFNQEQGHYEGRLNDGRTFLVDFIEVSNGKRFVEVEISG